MITKADIDLRYYGDDSDSKYFRGVVCGVYKGIVARREFYVEKNESFKQTGDALTQEATESIIKEINALTEKQNNEQDQRG